MSITAYPRAHRPCRVYLLASRAARKSDINSLVMRDRHRRRDPGLVASGVGQRVHPIAARARPFRSQSALRVRRACRSSDDVLLRITVVHHRGQSEPVEPRAAIIPNPADHHVHKAMIRWRDRCWARHAVQRRRRPVDPDRHRLLSLSVPRIVTSKYVTVVVPSAVSAALTGLPDDSAPASAASPELPAAPDTLQRFS